MLFARSAGRVVSDAVSAKVPLPSSSRNTLVRYKNRRLIFARYYNGPTAFPRADIPKPRSRIRRAIGFTTLAILSFWAGTAVVPYQSAMKILTTGIHSDEESLTIFQPSDELSQTIETHIMTHPLTQKYRNNPDFTESRPHMKIPEELRGRHLMAGALLGPNRVAVPPLVFMEDSGKELVAITYLGQEVCGHPGIVHGGLLATMLDEGLARCCFPVLPNNIGVTANLSIDYRRPVIADNYIVLRATTVRHEGRKAWVEGRIETLTEGDEEPVVLVEAKGLFVEPKYAANLSNLYKAARKTVT
ncbi:hypothetical protein EYB25_007915 [Talaromyces marneffei]|nr:hypothetical protein EYB25_007915 [Talaromyces marneffei]